MTIAAEKSGHMASSRERLLEAAKALFAKGGYEPTTTAAIARLAGTSESQLIKHFVNKQGLLEAIFEYAWEQINPALRLATESIASPKEKFHILVEMVLNFLGKDEELRTLFLLEGRRIRNDGKLVVLVPSFMEFVGILDGILQQIADSGELQSGIHLQAFRSALMGAVEGMLRDQILARSSGFPATYSVADIHAVCFKFLAAGLIG